MIRGLPKSWWTWWGCTWIHQNMPWCSPVMRRARFKRWTARRKVCRFILAGSRHSRMTTNVMGRRRCLLRSNWPEGRIISDGMPRHRHQEWIKFLKQIDAQTPSDLDLHLIVDNYATHKHPKVLNWLKRHKRFHIHFIPTSSSWLNVIERWFRDITQNRIRNGVFKSVEQLQAAIKQYIDHHNANPKTFVWTKKAEDILEKVARARKALNKIPSA